MNKSELRKLVEKASLQINNADFGYFRRSFSAILPMVAGLLNREIDDNTIVMERIISTPLRMSELNEVRHQLNTKILSREEIEKNSPLKSSKIVINKRHS